MPGTSLRRIGLGLAVIAVLAGAGCGGDDEDDPQTGQTTETSTSTSTTTEGPEATETATSSDETDTDTRDEEQRDAPDSEAPGDQAGGTPAACPARSYLSSSFAGQRSFSTPFGPAALRGQGRGLRVDFRGRRWRMRGRPNVKMSGQAAGITGTVSVDGSVRGRLRRTANGRYVFRQGRTRGTVTLSGLGTSFELPVSVVAPSILPLGRARIACDGDRAVIRSRSGTLRLRRP